MKRKQEIKMPINAAIPKDEYSIDNTCRTCLKHCKNPDTMIALFDKNNVSTLNELDFLKLKVTLGDGLPQTICKQCMKKLAGHNAFRTKCLASQEILEEYFKPQIKTEEPAEEEEDLKEESATAFDFLPVYSNDDNHNDDSDDGNANDDDVVMPEETQNFVNEKQVVETGDKQVEETDGNKVEEVKNVQNGSKIEETNEVLDTKEQQQQVDDESEDDQDKDDEEEDDEGEQLDCNICGRQFKKVGNLKRHKKNCDPDDYIGLEKFEKEKFISDWRKDDREKKLYCKQCGKRFSKPGNVSRHMKICDINSEAAQKQLARNKRYVKERKFPFLCIRCGKRFAKPSGLKQHKNEVKCVPDVNPKCRFCKFNFEDIKELETHLRERHPPERPHMCLICLKTFKSVSNRNYHQQSHNDGEPYKCESCVKSFKCKLYLDRHIKLAHTFNDHECEQCNMKFDNTIKYEKHVKLHDVTRQYKCKICDKAFIQQSVLTVHERTHDRFRPYLCSTCGKDFRHENNLKTHLLMHAGIRPHKCDICGKDFIQHGNLIQHMRRHNGIRPHQCEHCGKKFVQRSALIGHIRTHTGEKPYRCLKCDRNFGHRKQLKTHKCRGNPVIDICFKEKRKKLPKVSTSAPQSTQLLTPIVTTEVIATQSEVHLSPAHQSSQSTILLVQHQTPQLIQPQSIVLPISTEPSTIILPPIADTVTAITTTTEPGPPAKHEQERLAEYLMYFK